MAATDHVEPLAIKASKACEILDCSTVHLWKLMSEGELEHFLDGRFRKVTMASLKAYIARRQKAPVPPLTPAMARALANGRKKGREITSRARAKRQKTERT